jgi:hypothetical protein
LNASGPGAFDYFRPVEVKIAVVQVRV